MLLFERDLRERADAAIAAMRAEAKTPAPLCLPVGRRPNGEVGALAEDAYEAALAAVPPEPAHSTRRIPRIR